MLERLDQQRRLTSNQWKLIITGNLADLLDFFDFFLIGYVLAFITKEWQLTYWQGAVILLSSGIGAGLAFVYFASWYVLGIIAYWFIGFETKGRSFEEIDAALGGPSPVEARTV